MNTYSDFIGDYRDISGFNLETLKESDINDLILFLDIDDTLGKAISNESEIFNTQEEIKSNQMLKLEQINSNLYYFEFLTKETIEIFNLKQDIIRIHKIYFQFKSFIRDFFCFLKKRNIINICLFSAGSMIYIECIKIILNKYFLESEIHIENYISVFSKERMTIHREQSNSFFETLLYIPKDMFEALNTLGFKNKIPLLIDDRGYWGANGFVININSSASTIYDFIEKSIEKTKGLLINI